MAPTNVGFALGLAQRAGKLASGDFAVKAALKSGKAKLMVLAADAAPNSKKEMYYLAEQANIPVLEALTREELGHVIGKVQRTAVVILDNNFAKMLQR